VRVVIVGCSRLGARLAAVMDSEGHSVTVIDLDSSAFRRLPDSYSGATVIGTGIDEDILLSAGIDHADVFIAATNGDNRNIMAAQMAKQAFGVKQVLCRIYDPVRAEKYHSLGIETICPTTRVADMFLSAITTEAAGSN
jgi:trk system potassium uptake protein